MVISFYIKNGTTFSDIEWKWRHLWLWRDLFRDDGEKERRNTTQSPECCVVSGALSFCMDSVVCLHGVFRYAADLRNVFECVWGAKRFVGPH